MGTARGSDFASARAYRQGASAPRCCINWAATAAAITAGSLPFTPALQAGGDDVEVFGVRKTHDQHARLRGDVGHCGLHRRRVFAGDPARQIKGEDFVAAVDPVHTHRQRQQGAHDGLADMAAAEQSHGQALRIGRGFEACAQRRGASRLHCLEAQMHHTAAALAERGAEREAACGVQAFAGQRAPRVIDGFEFEMAAADGADHGAVGQHAHPGAGLARHRALCRFDRHQHGRLARQAFQHRIDQGL